MPTITIRYSIKCLNVDTQELMFEGKTMDSVFVPNIDDFIRLPDNRIYEVIGRVYDMVKPISRNDRVPIVLYCRDMTDKLAMKMKEKNYASDNKS